MINICTESLNINQTSIAAIDSFNAFKTSHEVAAFVERKCHLPKTPLFPVYFISEAYDRGGVFLCFSWKDVQTASSMLSCRHIVWYVEDLSPIYNGMFEEIADFMENNPLTIICRSEHHSKYIYNMWGVRPICISPYLNEETLELVSHIGEKND